jgi:hypothetical protein
MDDATRIAAAQLARMRGMTRYYHDRFFSDIRYSTTVAIALLVVGWWGIGEAFLLIPVVALLGATLTAFDASYLVFARQYAARLEARIDRDLGSDVLVAARLEDAYLFPLDRPKIVTAAFGDGFTWFGFMTLFLTGVGAALFGFGLALGLPVLRDHGDAWTVAYLATLGTALGAAVAVGVWWFPLGTGERRLSEVLDRDFDAGRG